MDNDSLDKVREQKIQLLSFNEQPTIKEDIRSRISLAHGYEKHTILEEFETLNVKLKAFGITSLGQPFCNKPQELQKTISAVQLLIQHRNDEIMRLNQLSIKLKNQEKCVQQQNRINDSLVCENNRLKDQKIILQRKLQNIERSYQNKIDKLEQDYRLVQKVNTQLDGCINQYKNQLKKKDQSLGELKKKLEDKLGKSSTFDSLKVAQRKINIQYRPLENSESYSKLATQNSELNQMLKTVHQEMVKTLQLQNNMLTKRRDLEFFNSNQILENRLILSIKPELFNFPLSTSRHAIQTFDTNVKRFQQIIDHLEVFGTTDVALQQYSIRDVEKIKVLSSTKTHVKNFRLVIDNHNQIVRRFIPTIKLLSSKQKQAQDNNRLKQKINSYRIQIQNRRDIIIEKAISLGIENLIVTDSAQRQNLQGVDIVRSQEVNMSVGEDILLDN